jgi:pantoate--beta-alanine ligase
VVPTFAEARHDREGVVGVVPTMGFLHEGHLSLIEQAHAECDTVIVTLFVNPLQFGEETDLAAYPRDLGRDTDLAAAAGADVLFAPGMAAMFGEPTLTTVHVAEIGDTMEGLHRPGHFTGVATVVAKLFAGLRPDRAFFGRKDAQQLVLIRRMTTDLSFPIDVVACPTVRERDGLALSSRNTRLDPAERGRALDLSRGLLAAADAAESGEREGRVLETIVAKHIGDDAGITLDYAALASQRNARPIDHLDEPAFLAAAVRVGETRLIDNVHFDGGADGVVADRGRLLTAPSVLYEEV